jgi:anti-anti-sigma factor
VQKINQLRGGKFMPVTSTVTGDGKLITIHISGQFNFSIYKEFREAYQRAEQPETIAYVIDMAGTEYMDSSALGMLLLLRERAGSDRADIAINHCNPEIRKIFRISNFDRLFRIE